MNLRLMALNIRQFCPDLSIPVIKQRINMRYKQLLGYDDWAFLHKSATLRLYGMHSSVTGESVSITQSGVTVTGTGTTFTAWDTGDRLKVDGDTQPYVIDTVNSDTELLLEYEYATASVTDEDYSIFRALYTPDVTGIGEIRALVYDQPLAEVSLAWLNRVDPERTTTGKPQKYRVVSKSLATGEITFEIWPIPDADYVLTLFYKEQVAELTADTDEPVFRPELIEAGALWDCYRQQFALTQNPAYMGLARDAMKEYETMLRTVFAEDLRTDSISSRVRDVMDRIDYFDDNFRLQHDVE